MNRLDALKKFVADEPEDPFNRYALALEVLKSDSDQAFHIFEELIKRNAQYLPTYYPFAQLLVERKNKALAAQILMQGMEIAKKQNDEKTLREMQGAYRDWMEE